MKELSVKKVEVVKCPVVNESIAVLFCSMCHHFSGVVDENILCKYEGK